MIVEVVIGGDIGGRITFNENHAIASVDMSPWGSWQWLPSGSCKLHSPRHRNSNDLCKWDKTSISHLWDIGSYPISAFHGNMACNAEIEPWDRHMIVCSLSTLMLG